MYILPPSFSIPNNLYVSILKSCVTSGCPTTYAPRNRHESKPRSSFLFSLLSCFSFDQFPILSLSLSRLMDELRSRRGRGFNKSTSIVARTRRQTAEEAQVSVKSLSNGGRQHRLSRFPPPPCTRSIGGRACLVGLFSFLAWIEACDPVEERMYSIVRNFRVNVYLKQVATTNETMK